MMKFANVIGQKIQKECPGKAVMFYGYFPTFTAPGAKLETEDNVVMMLCKEGGLTRFIRNGNLFNAAIGQPQFKDNYLAWKNLGYQMAIYEWNCPGAASDKWKDMFWLQGEVFLDNLKWLKQNGTRYLCMDQGPNPAYERADGYMDIRWPLWYVSAKGMWDCNLSFEDILMPACKKLFGPAAADMYAFYKALNDANKNCTAPNYYWRCPSRGRFTPLRGLQSGRRHGQGAGRGRPGRRGRAQTGGKPVGQLGSYQTIYLVSEEKHIYGRQSDTAGQRFLHHAGRDARREYRGAHRRARTR